MMVAPEQHRTIERLLNASLILPGDVVEAGCNAGSTSRLLAEWLAATDRNLHLFDSFEGLPEDSGYAGQMATPRANVEAAICEQLATECVPDFVKIHAGWFRRTMPTRLPDSICFAFVDCDVFESAIDALKSIMPRLTGCVVVHDYTHERWGPGIARALAATGLNHVSENGMAVAWREWKC